MVWEYVVGMCGESGELSTHKEHTIWWRWQIYVSLIEKKQSLPVGSKLEDVRELLFEADLLDCRVWGS
jgi:hypothetical protein